MPVEGGQYEPKQAAVQCSLISISVAAVVTQMAHMYTLWCLGRSGLNSCRQKSVCVNTQATRGHTHTIKAAQCTETTSTGSNES